MAEVFKKFNPGGVDPGCLAPGNQDAGSQGYGAWLSNPGYWSPGRSGLRVAGPEEEIRFPNANRQRPEDVESGAKERRKHLPDRAAWL